MHSHVSKPLILLNLTLACCIPGAGKTAQPTAIPAPTPTINSVPAITPIMPIVVPITPIIEKPPVTAPQTPPPITPVKAIAIPIIPPSKLSLPTIKPGKPPITAKAKLTLDPKKYYQVRNGDNLDSISKKSGQSFKNLAKWNHLSPPYAVQNGQILNLFDLSGPTPAKQQPLQQTAPGISLNKKNRDGIQKSTISLAKNKQITNIISSPENSAVLISDKEKTEAPKKAVSKKGKSAPLSFKWPINGKIIKGFSKSNNQGIDIENKMAKQTVIAAEAGQVVYAGSGLSNLKNLIIIKHDQQYLTAYANNSKLLVTEEQHVKTGQTIAEITTQPKKNSTLHFEIRKNGTPINPMNLLSKKP
jgi:lipoprotein NlpD